MKIVLSVNAGSSSVKVSVYSVAARNAEPRQLAEAQVNGLTAPPPKVDYSRHDGSTNGGKNVVYKDKKVTDIDDKAGSIDSQDDAFAFLLRLFVDDKDLQEIDSHDDIAIVTHRIVHGGDYTAPQIVVDDTYAHIEALNDLAPLHNAKSLEIVRSCLKQLPQATNVACFDSQFHATLPPHIRTYPIDPVMAKSNMLRKYGFHGLSYAFITRAVADFLGKPVDETSIIALHLGSGASACAIRGGKSWDTSMGLTPLAGLPGATRSGSVDPSLVFHYASDVGKLSPASTKDLHISRAEEILNKEAGWKALTGTTDFGEIAGSDKPSHQLAFDLFVDRVSAYVGSYYVALKGEVDALVFAGGIGEHSNRLRAAVVDQCSCLGFAIDSAANGAGHLSDVVTDLTGTTGSETNNGSKTARRRVVVCKTDEQLEMAREGSADESLWADRK
ncbi:acetate kinase [Sporothrix brasiliensis 5110]|uniref:Probable acetate kinase n=1 Tax=Sporothrix brasiliensis 5110 TaxID=1398154 RepID=A0A0C2F1F2_9PEZI|nr:acetate kinase [Sporothrix brasiliensis 5110]KIH92729.1 acetate kinase [Sporothrix brasiliensis 5110]